MFMKVMFNMSNIILEKGKIQFNLGEFEKDIVLSNNFVEEKIVINLSSNINENVFIKNIQSSLKTITISKSSQEISEVNYIIIETQ